jgi:hypothetical protein
MHALRVSVHEPMLTNSVTAGTARATHCNLTHLLLTQILLTRLTTAFSRVPVSTVSTPVSAFDAVPQDLLRSSRSFKTLLATAGAPPALLPRAKPAERRWPLQAASACARRDTWPVPSHRRFPACALRICVRAAPGSFTAHPLFADVPAGGGPCSADVQICNGPAGQMARADF